jgi:plasmid stabilization system protein ParE
MAFTVRITTRAFNDIRQNIDWWCEHRSAEQAGEWCDLVLRQIDGLGVMPESYPLASENQKTPYELREMHVGPSRKTTHRVLFRIQSETIEVLAVRHASADSIRDQDLALTCANQNASR